MSHKDSRINQNFKLLIGILKYYFLPLSFSAILLVLEGTDPLKALGCDKKKVKDVQKKK